MHQMTLSDCIFSAIEKLSSLGCALEHLESSGSKVFMTGPIVHKFTRDP